MPRLNLIEAQNAPGGQLPVVGGAQPVDLRGVARGADAISGAFQQLRDVQERRSLELSKDEAHSHTINTVSRLQSQMLERLQQAEQQAPADAKGFTESTMKEWEKTAEQSINEAPEMAKPLLKNELLRMGQVLHARAFSFETKQRQAAVVNDFGDGLAEDQKIVFADPGRFKDALARRVALARTLNLPQDVKAKMEDQARQALAWEAGSATVERDPLSFLNLVGVRGAKVGKDGKVIPSDPAKAAEAVKNDPVLSNLAPERLRALVDRATMLQVQREQLAAADAERRRHQAEIEANKRARAADQAWNILSSWARDGKTADPVASAPLLKAIQGTPYQAAYVEMAASVANRSAVGTLPIVQQQAQLDALMAQRNKGGTSPGLEDEIKSREQIIAAAKRDFTNDAPGAMLERGHVKAIPPIDITNPESLKARADLTATASAIAGQQVSPLRPQEATAMADWMGKLAPAEKEAVVQRFYSSMGYEGASAVFNQIGKDAPLMAVAAGLAGMQTVKQSRFLGIPYGQTERRSVSQLMFEGSELLKTKQVHLPEATGRTAEFLKYAGNAIPNPKAREMAIAATDAIYAKLAFEAGKFDDKHIDPGLYQQAASFVTGRVIDHNGAKILPPGYGMDESQARNVLMGVTPAQVKAWGGVAGMTDEQAADYIKRAPLESQTIGKYRVLAGSGVLQRKDGRPFEMKF